MVFMEIGVPKNNINLFSVFNEAVKCRKVARIRATRNAPLCFLARDQFILAGCIWFNYIRGKIISNYSRGYSHIDLLLPDRHSFIKLNLKMIILPIIFYLLLMSVFTLFPRLFNSKCSRQISLDFLLLVGGLRMGPVQKFIWILQKSICTSNLKLMIYSGSSNSYFSLKINY